MPATCPEAVGRASLKPRALPVWDAWAPAVGLGIGELAGGGEGLKAGEEGALYKDTALPRQPQVSELPHLLRGFTCILGVSWKVTGSGELPTRRKRAQETRWFRLFGLCPLCGSWLVFCTRQVVQRQGSC